jgi:hypothetical protein
MMNLLQVTIDLNAKRGEVTNFSDFDTTLERFLQGIFFVAALITFFYMVWGAMDWIMAGGDEGKISSARKKLTGSIVGLVVLACTAAIFLVVQHFLGIRVLTR